MEAALSQLEEITQAVVAGDEEKVSELCQTMLQQGFDPVGIIGQGLLPGMDRVESDYRSGIKYIPEILMAARAIAKGMDQVERHLGDAQIPKLGKVVIGTVKGDIHDIGKQLVKVLLESAGFEVIDLGTNVAKEEFIEAIRRTQASVVLISAMLTTMMANMKDVVEAIHQASFDHPVTVMVGGNPVTSEFAQEIHAVFSDSAIEARENVKKIMREAP